MPAYRSGPAGGRVKGSGRLMWFEPREIKIQKASVGQFGPHEAHVDAQVTVQDLTGPGQGLAHSRFQGLSVALLVSLENP